MSPSSQLIAILRQLVLVPDTKPEPLARQLARRGIAVTAGQVREVIEHYALEKTTPLEIIELINRVGNGTHRQLRRAVAVPPRVRLDFDPAIENSRP